MLTDDGRLTRRDGPKSAICAEIETWFQDHGVPQFMHRYSATDRLPLLLLMLLTILAFELGPAPWLKLTLAQLLIAPLILILLALWARPALAAIAGLPIGASPRWWSIILRLVAFGVTGYLLARSDLPRPYSDPWVDFAVLFLVAIATLALSSHTLWTRIDGTHRRAGRALIAALALVIVAFALEGAAFPGLHERIDWYMPQAVPALLVMALIVLSALLLLRAGRQSAGGAHSERAVAAYLPAVPLLVMLLGLETAVLPHAVLDDWMQAAGPLGLLLAVGLLALVRARRAPMPDTTGRLAGVSGRAMVLWWIAPVFVFAFPVIVLVYLEIDVFGSTLDGLPAFVVTSLINLTYFFVAVLIVRIGLDRIAQWAGHEARHNLRGVAKGLARGLPLLLVFTVFLFMNAELWQVVILAGTGAYLGLVALLFALGLAFVVFSSSQQLTGQSAFDDWPAVRAAALRDGDGRPDPPTGGVLRTQLDGLERSAPRLPRFQLRRLGWFNATAIVTVYQAFIFLPLTIVSWAVFLGLGRLLVPKEVAAEWIYGDAAPAFRADQLVARGFFDEPWTRVALALAAFSFLYLAVEILSDKAKRDEFFEGVDEAVRQRFAVRLTYIKLVPAEERERR